MKVLALIVSTSLLLASVVQAATITQTKTFSGTPSYSSVLTFNQFDDLSGSLTLLSIEVIGNLSSEGGSLKLDADGSSPASGTVEFGAQASITPSVPMNDSSSMPIFQSGDLKATGGASLSLTADDGDLEVGGTSSFSYDGNDYDEYIGGLVSDRDSGFVNSGDFSRYTGTSTFTVTVDTSQVADYGAIGGAQAQIDPLTTSGTFEVIYTYVPEPASLTLLALGGLAMLRRRRK